MPRAKAYDEVVLLDRAMETFWSQGYRRTSVEDLVGRTGVNRASLYGVYPDKHALFIGGVRRYLDQVVENNIRHLREVEPAGESVRQLFLKLVEAPIEQLRRGCLLTNSAVEFGMKDPEVAALVRKAYRRVELALSDRLVEAQAAGQLAKGVQPKALARLLLTVLQGVRVMARVGTDRDVMRDAVEISLAGIRTPQAGNTTHARRRRQVRRQTRR